MNWWASSLWHQSPALFASWAFWVIFSIVMHELAHGWAALRSGDDTPRATGHMTWNPMVHMGPMSLLMFAIIGIAWGAMPVNPLNFRGRHDEAIVAGAGPAMNLGLGMAACLLGAAWILAAPGSLAPHLSDNIRAFFFVGAAVNIALMLLNLLPIPPLDGSRILAHYADGYRRLIHGEHGTMIALFGLVVIFYAVGGRVFELAFSAAGSIIRGIVGAFSAAPVT